MWTHYLGEVETFIMVCGKYIQDNKYKLLLESVWFCRWRDKKHLVCFWVRSSSSCSLTKHKCQVSQGSVATLFMWARKSLNYCIANLFKTMYTKFYQNRLGFVEDMTKTLRCFFRFAVYMCVSESSWTYPSMRLVLWICRVLGTQAWRAALTMGASKAAKKGILLSIRSFCVCAITEKLYSTEIVVRCGAP